VPGIQPGYHHNKRHWNTVDLDGSIEDGVVRGPIADSYDLVVAGLPARCALTWAQTQCGR
jgi:predicted DNA-binding protein (MmcQ/YjbR family)